MKKLFVTLALLCAFIPTWAQFNYPTAAPMWFYLARMASPSFDTTTYGAPSFPGIWQFRQQPGDTGYYFSNGRRFMKVATGDIDLSLYYTKSQLQSAGDAVVNYGNVANIGAVKLLGRYSNSSGVAQEISVGSGLTLNTSTGVLTGAVASASNGLTLTGTDVRLGGTLNTTTTVNTGADNAFLVTKTDASNNVSKFTLGGATPGPIHLMTQQIGTQRIGEVALTTTGTLFLRSNNNGQPGQDARITVDGAGVSTIGSFTLGTDDASAGAFKLLTRNNSTGRVETVSALSATSPLNYTVGTGVLGITAAGSGVSGYVSNSAQTISGAKAFENNVSVGTSSTGAIEKFSVADGVGGLRFYVNPSNSNNRIDVAAVNASFSPVKLALVADPLEITGSMTVGVSGTNTSLQVNGSFGGSYFTTNSNITLGNNRYILRITTGGITITLPPNSGIEGRIYKIRNETATPCTISAVLIDGVSTTTLPANTYWEIFSDGVNWRLLSRSN